MAHLALGAVSVSRRVPCTCAAALDFVGTSSGSALQHQPRVSGGLGRLTDASAPSWTPLAGCGAPAQEQRTLTATGDPRLLPPNYAEKRACCCHVTRSMCNVDSGVDHKPRGP